MSIMEEKFTIRICSDIDYEDLVADIYFEDKIVAMLTQELGFKNLKIELYPPKNTESWDFRLDEFEKIITKAKQRLWELRRDKD